MTLALVVYSALAAHMLFLPYAYAPMSFDGAVTRFSGIEWMDLGSDQNVALVSRALTWLPIGLLGAATVAPIPRRSIELPALIAGTLLALVWAVAVNFCQGWFPARTVSLNNLFAEACGGLLGATAWGAGGGIAIRWWQRLRSGSVPGAKAALQCYVVLYLVAILTPFDFVTSAAELAEKIDRQALYAWWIAPVGCGPSSCSTKWVAVVLAAVPCGWWFASLRRNERHLWLAAAMVALVVGTAVEALHFLMVSGVTQGASVAARALGMALGAATGPGRRTLRPGSARSARPLVLAALPFYAAGLLYLGGWSRSARLGWTAGVQRLDEISWMPFFQEYYASYQATMTSLMSHAVAYGLVGVGAWLCASDRRRASALLAASVAAALCVLVETSKLWLADRLPDCTNVLIAAVAAFVVTSLLRPSPGAATAPPDGLLSTRLGA